MRTLMVGLYLLFYGILSFPMYVVLFVVGLFDKRAKAVASQKIVIHLGFRPLLFISGIKLTVKGKENIIKDESALYVFNHRGVFDVLSGYATAPYPTAFASKVEIRKYPIVSQWMKYMNCLFLDRKDIKKGMQTILDGIELLKNGTSVYIAPEGTRNDGDQLLEFHAASFKLAEKSKRPVVPVAINNSEKAFESQWPWIHRAHIIIEYCEPIYMEEMERAEKKKIGQTVRDILQKKYDKNQKEILF